MKWMKRIVVANSNCYRIFDYERSQKLKLIKELNVPENKLKNSQLNSDKSGTYASHSLCGKVAPEMANTKSIHINRFARELAMELEKEWNDHEYEELVMVLPPHMDGLLDRHLSKEVKKHISCKIQKNLIRLSELGLLRYLNSHLWH